MARKDEFIEFDVPYNLQECSSRLRAIANQLRAQVGPLQGENDGLLEEHCDIEVYLEGKVLLGSLGGGKYWVVQAYVRDLGESCHVVLDAVGDSLLSRLLAGGKNANNFKKAVEKRDMIAQMLKQ